MERNRFGGQAPRAALSVSSLLQCEFSINMKCFIIIRVGKGVSLFYYIESVKSKKEKEKLSPRDIKQTVVNTALSSVFNEFYERHKSLYNRFALRWTRSVTASGVMN